MTGKGQGQRTGRSKATATKTNNADKSINQALNVTELETSTLSNGDLTGVQEQLDKMSIDIGQIKTVMKEIMKKKDIESFITQTVTDIMKSLEETLKVKIEKQVNEKCEKLQEQIDSVTFENNELKEDLKSKNETITKLKTECRESAERNTLKINEAIGMANYNEQYSRKNNIKIMDIPEDQYETEERLTEKVCSVLSKQGVNLQK